MNRRSFFSKLLQTAAIIGLAPRLAFRVPSESFAMPTPTFPAHDYEAWCATPPEIMCDRETKEQLAKYLQQYYAKHYT